MKTPHPHLRAVDPLAEAPAPARAHFVSPTPVIVDPVVMHAVTDLKRVVNRLDMCLNRPVVDAAKLEEAADVAREALAAAKAAVRLLGTGHKKARAARKPAGASTPPVAQEGSRQGWAG